MSTTSQYAYDHADATGLDPLIQDAVVGLVESHAPAGCRVLDLGCGNGYFSGRLARLGFDVVGMDNSASGIEQAVRHHAPARFAVGDCQDPSSVASLGSFDAVVSVEVIEHVPSTRAFVGTVSAALRPGGVAVITTPYHGWLKNVLVALLGRHDRHFDPLWEGGHLKFFSKAKLCSAFAKQGFELIAARRVGRVPVLAKSLVAAFRRFEKSSGPGDRPDEQGD